MKVDRVLETCLYAKDLTRAAWFYREVLGMQPISQVEGRHVFFRAGDGVFLLFNPGQTEIPGGDVPTHGALGPGHVAFAVPEADLPRWRESLADHGVVVEAEMEWPRGGRSLYVRDPAGNSVELATPDIWRL